MPNAGTNSNWGSEKQPGKTRSEGDKDEVAYITIFSPVESKIRSSPSARNKLGESWEAETNDTFAAAVMWAGPVSISLTKLG